MSTSSIGTTEPITESRDGSERWRERLASPGERDHTVQLYSDLGFLTSAVAHYALSGLRKGEAVLLVVTPAHRRAFLEHLERSGIDVRQRIDRGQLTILDAAATLSQFMVGGMPDRASFLPLIGGVIDLARVRGGYSRVRAYGEMVNLLWEKGELAAAIRLEDLWNELGKTHAFALHCAYAMDIFDPAAHCCGAGAVTGSALDQIRHAHAHCLIADDTPRLDQAVLQALTDVLGHLDDPTFLFDAPSPILGLSRLLSPSESETVLQHARHLYAAKAA